MPLACLIGQWISRNQSWSVTPWRGAFHFTALRTPALPAPLTTAYILALVSDQACG
jgi:hypothetical protein